MNYIEINISYSTSFPVEIVNDILANELGEIGFESFTEKENGIMGYIPESSYNTEMLNNQLNNFPLDGITFNVTENLIVARDWNEEWEKNYFKPIRIGKDCIIRASFHEPEPDFKHTIIIDPKMAFGTGNHETTYLMINEMLKLDLTGKEILDMGCGTAILAILASLKGAKQVTGIDIDEWAYRNALDNIQLNNTNDIRIAMGGAERIAEYAPFDTIFANINRNILLQDMEYYANNLRTDGLLLMSGFYKEDIPVIEEGVTRQGLSLESVNKKNNWVAVKCRKYNKI